VDKENVVYIHNGVLFSHKEERNYVICRKMDWPEGHHFEQNKPDSERQLLCIMWGKSDMSGYGGSCL
jgi:hypothetical protein